MLLIYCSSLCTRHAAGERKLRCISRQSIPEHPEADAHLLTLYRGEPSCLRVSTAPAATDLNPDIHILAERSEGRRAVPAQCLLDDPLPACPSCQQLSWGEQQWQPGQVILPAAVVQTEFELRSCTAWQADAERVCGHQLQVDGHAYGLLRQTLDLSFSHEVLYQWAERFCIDSADTWTAAWKHLISKAKGLTLDQQRGLFDTHRQHFLDATMDFVQLQHLDYSSAFSCGCWQSGHTCPCVRCSALNLGHPAGSEAIAAVQMGSPAMASLCPFTSSSPASCSLGQMQTWVILCKVQHSARDFCCRSSRTVSKCAADLGYPVQGSAFSSRVLLQNKQDREQVRIFASQGVPRTLM